MRLHALFLTLSLMNPSSLDIDISTVQSQKDMYKGFGSELTEDEGSPNLQ